MTVASTTSTLTSSFESEHHFLAGHIASWHKR